MGTSKVAVWAALLGNLAVMAAKFTAAGITGSPAIFAEALHSFADSGDGALLLLGQWRAKKPADELHPFGHGREHYFWSMVVALVIFMVGGVMGVVEGIAAIRHPPEMADPRWNYAVLAVALVFEGATGLIAARQFKKQMRPGKSVWRSFRDAKDPTVFMVLFEDTAAVVGVVIAFSGVWLSHAFNAAWIDGAASVAIGCLLMVVGLFLGREVMLLLIGERVSRELLGKLRRIGEADEGVAEVKAVHTMHNGPEDVLAILVVRFRGGSCANVEEAVGRIRRRVWAEHEEVKHIYVAVAEG